MPRAKKVVETLVEDNRISIDELKNKLDTGSLEINPTIPLLDERRLCEKVVEFCFYEDKTTNEIIFNPCGKELVTREYMLLYYVDIKYDELKEVEDFCYCEYFDALLKFINPVQCNSIINSIDELIELRKQKLSNNIGSDLSDLVSRTKNIFVKVEEFMGGLSMEDLKELLPLLTNLNEAAPQDISINNVIDLPSKKPAKKRQPKPTSTP